MGRQKSEVDFVSGMLFPAKCLRSKKKIFFLSRGENK